MSVETVNMLLAGYLRDYASVVYLLTDRDGNVLETNSYAAELIGGDCTGRNLRDLVVDFTGSFSLDDLADSPMTPKLLNISTARGLPQTFHFRLIDMGDRIIVLGEQNSLEVEELRQSLVDSTIQLSNLTRELHKKNAELTRLNELKNHFLGMAAHDLRNPLAAIKGYSDFLLEVASGQLQTDYVALLNDIRALSEFMLRMINDLLDISVIESGKLKMELWPHDLVDLIRQTMSLNRVFADKKDIRLTLGDTPPVCRLLFDGSKIKQVLNNLISNAIKFSHPDTTVTITVADRNGFATVAVRDQGQGIPANEMEKLFNPFAKMSVRSTSGEPSTGLGLAICHKIVSAHKGKIWAESREGEGTTFVFTLPLTLDPQEVL